MKKVEKVCRKQRLKNAELGTENHKTHDVKPKTENTKHETNLPVRSISITFDLSFTYSESFL